MKKRPNAQKIVFIAILIFFLTAARVFASAEEEWRMKQDKVVQTVLHLVKIGTRFPAYRCGLYVPGYGICYMKMSPVTVTPQEGIHGGSSDNAAGAYRADVAEVMEVSRMIGAKHGLEQNEKLYIQSRFTNSTYLRVLTEDLTEKIAATDKKNLLAQKKIMSEVKSWVDGERNDDTKKIDVWLSEESEKFRQGGIYVNNIKGEGIILPDKVIVVYRRYPGLWSQQGDKALSEKLYKILQETKVLKDYYPNYKIVVGVESGSQLFFARYSLEEIPELTENQMKYYRFSPVRKSPPKNGKSERGNND